ncbi:MAG: hypothetical protein M3410_04135, partial [Acidobacteriota bacterium]|nr:hypothetical protein [Acidobacteriota bacterium]
MTRVTKSDCNYVETPHLSQTTTYDAKGNEIEAVHYNADGSLQSRIVSMYGAAGKLIEKVHYGTDGSLSGRTVLIYDDEGKVVEKVFSTSAGYPTEKTVYTYDPSGGKVEELLVKDGSAGAYVVEGTVYNISGVDSVKSVYDADDKLIEVLFHNADDSLISKVVMTYDHAGNLLSSTQYIGEAFFKGKPSALANVLAIGDPFFRRLYVYNEQGRKIEEKLYFADSLSIRKTFAYDTGIKTEEVEYEADGSLRSRTRFSYEFDAIGNRIRETVSSWILESGQFEPTVVTY